MGHVGHAGKGKRAMIQRVAHPSTAGVTAEAEWEVVADGKSPEGPQD